MEVYAKKIRHQISFDLVMIKSTKQSGKLAEQKRKAEADQILSQLSSRDQLILFDEKGRTFSGSKEFSQFLVRMIERSANLCFLIGGAYGVDEEVKKRAQQTIRLSDLTMNHHVALVTAMEQIYRGLSIW